MKLKKFIILTKVAFVIVFGIIIRYSHASRINNQQVVVTADALLHATIPTIITDYLAENKYLQKVSLSALNDEIKKQSPAIAHVTSELYPPNNIHIHLHAHSPMLIINNSTVLTTAQTFVPQQLFVPSALTQCTAMAYHQSDDASAEFPSSLAAKGNHLRSAALNNYTIDWYNDHCTRLRSTQTPQFSIMCSADSIPTHEIIKQCEQIGQTIPTLSPKNKKKQHWVADIRFRNQIVVYNEEKGATYG